MAKLEKSCVRAYVCVCKADICLLLLNGNGVGEGLGRFANGFGTAGGTKNKQNSFSKTFAKLTLYTSGQVGDDKYRLNSTLLSADPALYVHALGLLPFLGGEGINYPSPNPR